MNRSGKRKPREIVPRSPLFQNPVRYSLVAQCLLRHPLFFLGDGRNRGVTISCRIELRKRNVPSQAKHAQGVDPVPVRIDLVPGNAVTSRLRGCMMIVMPAFTEREDRNPKTVCGVVPRLESLRPPHVRGGVYKPGGVETENSPDKNPPHQIWQSTND